jgi:UPF0716 protein FxsA
MGFVLKFFLLVIFLSSAELLLLLKFSLVFGFFATFLLCALTGIAGGALVRHQGLRTLTEIQRSLQRGKVPAEEIVSGFMLLLIGAFLIMPGFITDTLGLLLLIPPLRRFFVRFLIARFRMRVLGRGFTGVNGAGGATSFYATFGSAGTPGFGSVDAANFSRPGTADHSSAAAVDEPPPNEEVIDPGRVGDDIEKMKRRNIE